MGEILDFAERAWQGDMDESVVHPSRVHIGLEELDTGFAFVSAFSNLAALKTERGLCFFDTSSFFHAKRVFELIRDWSPARLDTAIYTHGHVDHVFGTGLFEKQASAEGWDPVHVIAHEACSARFDRYQRLISTAKRSSFGMTGVRPTTMFGSGCPNAKRSIPVTFSFGPRPTVGIRKRCSGIRANGPLPCARCRRLAPSGSCLDMARRSSEATAFIKLLAKRQSCWNA